MEDLLFSILDEFGYEYFEQGSLSATDDYPDHFFTHWNNDSSDGSHHDNRATSIIYDWDLNFYSCDPAMAYSVLREAITKLKQAGFIISGDGHSVASDEPTHTGRGVNILYRKQL